MKRRYNAYGPWLRKRFGTVVRKLTVDGGFTCPNRDGTVAWGGCSYCNNDSFRGYGTSAAKSIETQVREGIDYLERRFKAGKYLVYWQNYTNTYGPVLELAAKFSHALELDRRLVGMTIATRPDCIEDEKLEMIRAVAGDRYVSLEYGMESVYDETLKRVNRGHDFACFVEAVERTRRAGIDVCVHAIIGFPWETPEQWLSYVEVLNRLDIQFVKIHHLHVVKATQLANEFERKAFFTFSEADWVEFVCDFLERLRPEIVVQRLFGWAPEADLIAPRWKRTRAEMLLAIENALERRNTRQGAGLSGS
jgi:uncharacterized protein